MNDPQPQPTNHQRLLEKAMAHKTHGTGAPAVPAPPDLAELAIAFPDYEFIELIGRGGMGAVYQAVQRNLQRTVAIKVLPKELASDPEFGERFLREAQTLATLNHPGIITVYDYGDRNGVFFLVTEFVDGVNLRQLMELGELSPAEALRIAPQLCNALQFAHERGVVHRDIKPENILINTNGQVLVADFGLAKVARPGDAVELTRNTAVLGTPHYMAPEQWNGSRQVDHRADIYSLGVVLYEMLTGNLPLGNFDMPSERGGVPQGLDAVVRRALAQQPKNRYQHARDVQSDVERQAQQLGAQQASGQQASNQQSAAPNTAPAPQPRTNATMVKGPFLALAGVVLAALTIGYLAVTRQFEYRRAYLYEDALTTYQETVAQATTQVQNGQEATGVVPMPIAPPDPTVTIETVKVMSAGLAVGMPLLLLALGFASIRTIRNSRGRKSGLGLAVITAWIVPLGAVGGLICAPLQAIRSNDLQVILLFVVVSALIYGAARFLTWEHARQRRLVAASVPAVRGQRMIAAAMTMGLATIGTAVGASVYMQRKPDTAFEHIGGTPIQITDDLTTTRAAVLAAKDLLGKTRAEVIGLMGPPLGIGFSQSSEDWCYLNEQEHRVEQAVVFIGDYVASTDSEHPTLRSNPADMSMPQLGQSMNEFVKFYGSPASRTDGQLASKFTFDNGLTVTVRDGAVVGVEHK